MPRPEQWHLGIQLIERIGFVARYLEAEINGVKNCGGAAATAFGLLVWVK